VRPRRRLTGLASGADRLPFDAPIEERPDRISDLQSRQGILVWIVHIQSILYADSPQGYTDYSSLPD
jgi:hypothetical protein